MITSFTSNRQVRSPFLWSGSFDEGRYSRPWSGGNWDEYRRGQAERELYNRNTSNSSDGKHRGGQNGYSGGGVGGDGGNGFGIVIAGFFSIFLVIPSAVSALISSIFIILVAKTTSVSFSAISFGRSYTSAFWTTFTYAIVGVLLAFVQPWLFPLEVDWRIAGFTPQMLLKYYYFYNWEFIVSPSTLLTFHFICVVIASIALKVKMARYFKGFVGYGQAVVTTNVLILPAIFITLNTAFAILVHYYFKSIGQ